MKGRMTYSVWTCAALVVAMQIAMGCVRRPLDNRFDGETALVPVKVDWSESSIPVSESDPTGGGAVHRVSIRFFPIGGGPVFERYLEGNVFEGTIMVPPGDYSVVAMNESIHDETYWGDVITFSGVDDYADFSATVKHMTTAQRLAEFPYYSPPDGETVIVNPYRLASWSLDRLSITLPGMAAPPTGTAHNDLSDVKMRRLTYDVNVSANFKNLISTQSIQGAARGFAQKVYMASGLTEQMPATHLFRLLKGSWDPNGKDGVGRSTFLSFGRVPQADPGSYMVALDVLLVSGELWTEEDPLVFDVTDQVISSVGADINIDLSHESLGGQIDLPEVEGGIAVDEWDDDVIMLN